jgi:hypothetical protein
MEKKRYIYWQDEDMWIGYLEEYPDYMTQGETLEELKENLTDIYKDLTNRTIPHVRKVAVRRIGGLKLHEAKIKETLAKHILKMLKDKNSV